MYIYIWFHCFIAWELGIYIMYIKGTYIDQHYEQNMMHVANKKRDIDGKLDIKQ